MAAIESFEKIPRFKMQYVRLRPILSILGALATQDICLFISGHFSAKFLPAALAAQLAFYYYFLLRLS